MAAELLPMLARAGDSDNNPLSGALWYFYATGTTTPRSVYTTSTLDVAHANPVVADSAGKFAPIYFDASLSYRGVLKDAGGATIFDVDPINSGVISALSASSGAASVGFIQSGTGAVARTTQAKLRDFAVSPEDFGAVGDNTTDDTAAIQAAIDAVDAVGGGVVQLGGGLTYKTTSQLTLKAGVRLNLNEGKIHARLTSGTDAAVVVQSNCVVENGHIEVDSAGTPGTQAGIHAPIRVGNITGGGGTVATPAGGENPSGWIIRKMILESDKWVNLSGADYIGSAGVQVYGGANNGLIEGITIPDSDKMFGAVLMDWSYLGTISSTATQAAQDANKTAFNAGTAYTTHPNNISIRNIKIGNLSAAATGTVDVGSHGIRLSGVYNVTVENVTIEAVTYMALRHTAGDLGFEFAPTAVKPFACKNVIFRNIAVEANGAAYLAYSDSYADNVDTAVSLGYTSLIDPLNETNIVFEGIVGKAQGAGANYGIRIVQQRGGVVRDVDLSYYKQGINVDEKVYGLSIERAHCHFNREDGIQIHHGTNKPTDIRVVDPHLHDNGQDTSGYANSAGVHIGGSLRVTVEGGRFGRAGAYDVTQWAGIRVVSGALNVTIRDPYLRSARSADGYGIAISSGHNTIDVVSNARFETAYLQGNYAGTDTIPVARGVYPGSNGKIITEYLTNTGNTMSGLVVVQGDRFWYANATSAAAPGRVAVASGTLNGSNLDTLTKTMAVLA